MTVQTVLLNRYANKSRLSILEETMFEKSLSRRTLLKGMTAKSVLVVTDEVVPAGRLVEVVDQARLAGADDIGVATSVEAGEG